MFLSYYYPSAIFLALLTLSGVRIYLKDRKKKEGKGGEEGETTILLRQLVKNSHSLEI